MTTAELKKFRTVLESRHKDLASFAKDRETIAIDSSADMLDQIQAASERELAIRNLERDSLRMREVAVALALIDEGAYGICLACEEEIGLKRLTAIPWAATCLACQEIVERARHAPASANGGVAAAAA